ncbi:MAG: MaoC/PaaZ C-terminal domain-containing protein [Acidobacteriota bacterium]
MLHLLEPLYFDDFTIGQRFSHPANAVMELARMKQFASEFDPQPFHADEGAAKSHPLFAGLAASGWHTAAVTARLLVESVPLAGGLIGLGVEIAWPPPDARGRPAFSCHRGDRDHTVALQAVPGAHVRLP